MKLLVTGGAGFIGSTFVRRRLTSTDDDIIVIDKLTYAGSVENLTGLDEDPATRTRFRFARGDIADAQAVSQLLADRDAVVNFAAESHVDRSILDPTAFLRTGVMGVYTLLEAIRAANAARPAGQGIRFVQISTDEVYGSVQAGKSSESDVLDPRSPYSAAKAAGELLARTYHVTFGVDVVITRGSNTYGPRQHPEKLIPLFITNALTDQPLPLYGDGMQRRDWLFVDDHADGVGVVLDRGLSGEAYNIAGREERANIEVTRAILDGLGKPWSLVRRVPDRRGHDRRYSMDGSRLAALGWRPSIGFNEGMRATIDWYVANDGWWRRLLDADWRDYYAQQYGWRLEQSVLASATRATGQG